MNASPFDIVGQAVAWANAERRIALATVTKTWGSAPRQAGSQMIVREDGAFAGSVSGGCVEGAVIDAATQAITDEKIRNLSFGVSNDDAWAVGLACGGTVEIHVTPIGKEEEASLRALDAARKTHRPAILATKLNTQGMRVIFSDDDGAQGVAARDALLHDQSQSVSLEGEDWFFSVFNPPLDLVIIGAVHIAQPLAELAKLVDYTVRIIDPRTGFATAERFPGVTLVNIWADEALAKTPLTARSALVALTHDPKLDDPALINALNSPAFYVGALGSRSTHARRLERLAQHGFSAEQLARIRGPVGLAIGARTPAEIAVSVLAEMTKTLRHA